MKKTKQTYLYRRIISISAGVMVATLILYIAVILMMRETINDDLKLHNESMVNIAVDQIKDTVSLPIELMDNVDLMIQKGYPVGSTTVSDYLETIQVSYDYFTEIYLVSTQGKVLNTAPFNKESLGNSVLYEPYFTRELDPDGSQYWSELYVSSRTGKPTISVTINEGDYLLVATLDLERLPISFSSQSYFEEIHSISILDQWGSYIVSDDFEKVKQRTRYKHFDKILKKDFEESTFNKDLKIAYSVIDEMQWYIVFDFDYKEIYQNLNLFTLVLLIVWFVLIYIIFITVKNYFTQVTYELTYLKNRAHKMITNDYKPNTPVRQMMFIELDYLNKDFTVMMDTILEREAKIKSINENLENMVLDRTVDLERINTRLEDEIKDKEKAEGEVRHINETLDMQVKERTKELEFLNKVLKQSVEEAEAANQAKSTFLSIMSHEMRTPLNGIIGFIQILEKTRLSEEQNELMSIINGSSKLLVGLINDILDVEKYSAGKMIFVDETAHLKSVLLEAVHLFSSHMIAKDLVYSVDLSEDLNYAVAIDVMKIKQLLGNLISNAVKFTAEGFVKVSGHARLIDGQVNLHMEVRDSGIGIKDAVKPYLFTPFTQADGDISKNYGGTGLGLTICHEIVRHYKGTIDYDSTYGEGTTFKLDLVLPLAQNQQVDLVTRPLSLEAEAGVTYDKILLAEDNPVNQKLMGKYLEKMSIDFDMVSNGREALDRLERQAYGLIFMDCQMPVMDGFEATRAIRKKYGPDIQIIAMTAYASKEDEERCYEAGMDKFVSKPVDLDILDDLLGIQRKELMELEPSEDTSVLMREIRVFMSKVDFDYETSYDLLVTYRQQMLQGFQELQTNFTHKAYKAIQRKLHQLKGASAAVRVERVRDALMRAEAYMKSQSYDEAYGILQGLKEDSLFLEGGEKDGA